MADTAFQKQFRQEMIAGYEKADSCLTMSTTTEHTVRGNEAEFLVADSGGATATTRGNNGRIPARHDNNTQITCTLEEWHDKVEKTNFNIESSQGNQRKLMQDTTRMVINRKRDELIRTALNAATTTWGAAAVPTLTLVTKARTILRNNSAGDGEIFAAITPAYHGYLMGLNQFTSADFIQDKKFEGVSKDKAFSWYGVNWIIDEELTGVGTSSATCFMYNRTSIGSAMHKEGLDTEVGYNGEDAYSWCRATVHMGAKLLQNAGVIKMLSDDSALSA